MEDVDEGSRRDTRPEAGCLPDDDDDDEDDNEVVNTAFVLRVWLDDDGVSLSVPLVSLQPTISDDGVSNVVEDDEEDSEGKAWRDAEVVAAVIAEVLTTVVRVMELSL